MILTITGRPNKNLATKKKFWQNAGLTLRNINFLFCYCAAVAGAEGILLKKNFYLNYK